MRIRDHKLLDFQDVLLVPQRSSLDSRSEVVLIREFKFPNREWTLKCIPIIAANLDTVGSMGMAKALSKYKMLTALHKHYSEDDLANFFKLGGEEIWDYTFCSVGTSSVDLEKIIRVASQVQDRRFPRLLCLDAANGYTGNFVRALVALRQAFPQAVIMAGNVATGNMTEELLLQGADIVKVGIGSGSLCETRIKTGVGVPQLSAVDMCAYQAHGLNGYICSDGGVRCVGDICKAFCAGADFVMLGGFLSATEECEGEWIDGKLRVYGMSSKAAMTKWYGGIAPYRTSEGREVLVPSRGSVSGIVQDIKGGIASCCSYIGCTKIKDMPKCAEFIRVNRQYNDMFERQ